MEKDSHRYTEEDLHNVEEYETSLQILTGFRKIQKTAPPRPGTIPMVRLEGKPDLPLTKTEWEVAKGFERGVANQLIQAGKGCIVREIAQKYK